MRWLDMFRQYIHHHHTAFEYRGLYLSIGEGRIYDILEGAWTQFWYHCSLSLYRVILVSSVWLYGMILTAKQRKVSSTNMRYFLRRISKIVHFIRSGWYTEKIKVICFFRTSKPNNNEEIIKRQIRIIRENNQEIYRGI